MNVSRGRSNLAGRASLGFRQSSPCASLGVAGRRPTREQGGVVMGAWDRFSEWLSALLVASLVWLNGALTPVAPDAAGSEPVPATTAPTLTLAWAQDESAPPIEQVGEGQSGDVERLTKVPPRVRKHRPTARRKTRQALTRTSSSSIRAPRPRCSRKPRRLSRKRLLRSIPPMWRPPTQLRLTPASTRPPRRPGRRCPRGSARAVSTSPPVRPASRRAWRTATSAPSLAAPTSGSTAGTATRSSATRRPLRNSPSSSMRTFPFGDQGAPGAETQEPSPRKRRRRIGRGRWSEFQFGGR